MSQFADAARVVVNALGTWWDDWVNLVVINLVWALCCLTIVLGPPATFGLVYVVNRLIHGEALGLGGFWQGLRRYAWQSWLWALANLAVGGVVYANAVFYGGFDVGWARVLEVVVLGVVAGWAAVQLYAVPFLIEQSQSRLVLAWRNGLFMLLAAPGYSLVVIIAVALVAILSIGLVAPLLLGGPGLIAAIANQAVIERLERYHVRARDTLLTEPDEPQGHHV